MGLQQIEHRLHTECKTMIQFEQDVGGGGATFGMKRYKGNWKKEIITTLG